MKMKQMISIVGLLLGSAAAMAGRVQPAPVEVTMNEDGSGYAWGDLVTARYSENDFEVIGCGVRRFADGDDVTLLGFCQATSADNVRVACFTDDPRLIDSLASLNVYSYISFSWDADQACTSIGNSTNSFYLPAK
jgi:hypothetical protein